MPMKPSRVFFLSRFSSAPHLFYSHVIQQLVVHDVSPPANKTCFLSRIRPHLIATACSGRERSRYESCQIYPSHFAAVVGTPRRRWTRRASLYKGARGIVICFSGHRRHRTEKQHTEKQCQRC